MNIPAKTFGRIERPDNRDAISELVCQSSRIEVAGAQTHGELIPATDEVVLADMTAYTGIIEYEPQEYVISARAGTTIREIAAELRQHNQYLPFDPPDASPGTTIGGVVATGWSGPGCLRYGRLRDFIIGVDMVPGTGRWIKGGGKVVKNAAGFDLPKLMVGSLGCLGIIGEVTLKVFPSTFASTTIMGDFGDFESGYSGLKRINSSGITLDGCVLEPAGRLVVRLRCIEGSLSMIADKIRKLMGIKVESINGIEEIELWQNYRNSGPGFSSGGRCKIPIRPSEVPQWQDRLENSVYRYFYDQSGSVLIVDIDEDMAIHELIKYIGESGRSALCTGLKGGPRLLGSLPDKQFIDRIRGGLDPQGKFPCFSERYID